MSLFQHLRKVSSKSNWTWRDLDPNVYPLQLLNDLVAAGIDA